MSNRSVPKVGPSTVAVWITAAIMAGVGIWQNGGATADVALIVSAVLVAVNNLARSWQSLYEPDGATVDDSTS